MIYDAAFKQGGISKDVQHIGRLFNELFRDLKPIMEDLKTLSQYYKCHLTKMQVKD